MQLRRALSHLVGALLGTTLVHISIDVSAQTQRFELAWHAPKGCPSQSDVEQEITQLIPNAGSLPATPVKAQADIALQSNVYALRLTLISPDGARSRSIGAPTCEELAHAAALIVAIAVDPSILERSADPSVPNLTPGSDTVPFSQRHCRLSELPSAPVSNAPCLGPTINVTAPPPTKTISTAPERPFWRLGLGTLASLDVLPGLNLGVNVLGAVQGRWARFELSASMLSGSKDSGIPTRSADFSLYRLAPRSCLVSSTDWIAAGPCLGVEFGLLHGDGNGVSREYERSVLWLASTIGGMIELRLGASALLLIAADLGLPWRRDRFVLAGELLYRPSGSGTLGVSLAAGWP